VNNEWGILNDLPFTKNEIKALTRLPRVVEYIEDLQKEVEEQRQIRISVKGRRKKAKTHCIAQIDPKSKEIVAVYKSILEASESIGINYRNLYDSIDKLHRRSKGFIFRTLKNFRICSECGFQGKEDEYFSKSHRGKNGTQYYKSKCKECVNKQKRREWKEKKCTK